MRLERDVDALRTWRLEASTAIAQTVARLGSMDDRIRDLEATSPAVIAAEVRHLGRSVHTLQALVVALILTIVGALATLAFTGIGA